MAPDDLLLHDILDRMARMEAKMDKLIGFRSWLLGWAAGVSALMTLLVSWVRGH